MRTLEIKLPDEIFGVLSSLAKKQDKCILEAIKEKVEREKNRSLKKLLIEGYKSTANEDLELTKEFESADLENL